METMSREKERSVGVLVEAQESLEAREDQFLKEKDPWDRTAEGTDGGKEVEIIDGDDAGGGAGEVQGKQRVHGRHKCGREG